MMAHDRRRLVAYDPTGSADGVAEVVLLAALEAPRATAEGKRERRLGSSRAIDRVARSHDPRDIERLGSEIEHSEQVEGRSRIEKRRWSCRPDRQAARADNRDPVSTVEPSSH